MPPVLTSSRSEQPAKNVCTLPDPRIALFNCISCDDHEAAVFELVALIARELDSERVSFGTLRGDSSQLKAVSGLAGFDRRMQLVRQIENAMDEALEQGAAVASMHPASGIVNLQQQALVGGRNRFCISLPVGDERGIVGVLTIEKNSSRAYSAQTLAWLENLSRDREWNEGAAKTQLFTIFDALKPNDPIVLNGRRKLSSMIFA